MDRYKCRLCFKSFVNGKALGGHMRSHMLCEEEEGTSQLNEDYTESDASSSSDEEEEEDHDNPKRNRELEFEIESKINPTRRRSKRTRKLGSFDFDSTEQDLAICLVMLSRDKWKKIETDHECEEDYNRSSKKGRFKCETCGKLFKSYQALGGHRASHKKNKKTEEVKTEYVEKKIHECPICFRVFSSGQALGGHKRSHGSNIGARFSVNQSVRIEKQRIIDLNLPAPNEEDETSVVFDEW